MSKGQEASRTNRMLRKAGRLTCAVLVCENLAQTMVFVIFVAIVTLVIESETKPYINPFINAFTHVCWCVRGFPH